MARPHAAYRALVRLYPRSFRSEYGDDLVDHHADLIADRGAGAAWARTALDVLVTLPRYHLEHVMSERHGTTALGATIGLLVAAGAAGLATGLYPGTVVLLAAVVLAVTQRSDLARSLRTPDSNLRRRRLRTAAALAALFFACFVTFLALVGDTMELGETVLAVVGTVAMVGAPVFLIAGLVTPRTPDQGSIVATR